MNAAGLHGLTRLTCLVSAGVGMALTVFYSTAAGPLACCGTPFLYITARFAADFVVAPLVAGFSLGRFDTLGRAAFWTSCAWMAVATWPPYLIVLAALCVWTRVRLNEASAHAQPAP